MAQPPIIQRGTLRKVDSLVNMDTSNIVLSRISKLFVDSSAVSTHEALGRRKRFVINLRCGADVEQSRTLQLALLTAANIAARCFPGAVRVVLEGALGDARLRPWPSLAGGLGSVLADIVGRDGMCEEGRSKIEGPTLLFGNASPVRGALRVTFDGWIAKVGPAAKVHPLPQRQYCALSGVLAGALAISEMFLLFAELSIEAGRRTVGLSLWRPDLNINDPDALGVPVEILPRALWVLGLGHLGNAYLWTLATLPYAQPNTTEIYLNDFDEVEPENVETGMIFNPKDEGQLKTRICNKWLEDRGFRTRLIERHFDSNFRCRTAPPQVEPQLALCGFDSNPARRDLATARFARVMESGLGGTKDNFDTISLHTLPNPRPATELWPDLTPEQEARQHEDRERLARENPAYRPLANDECGRTELAGKSVAVPFVGATAATLVLAEAIRLLHGGPAYSDIKLPLVDFASRFAETSGNYTAQDCAGIEFCDAIVDDESMRR
jgi:hypothetical protein